MWSYMHLPNDLIGTRNGLIRGHFLNDGYYTFGAICADKRGSVLDYFFTLNVQGNVYDRFRLVQVPIRNPYMYTWIDLARIQEEAARNLKAAF